MIGRLFINGQNIELSEGLPVPFIFSVSDLKNPQDRKRSQSKSIPVPGTESNMAFFSSTYQLSLSAGDGTQTIGFRFDPTIRIAAQYYKNGKKVFDGLAQLLSVTIDDGNYTFNVALYSNFIQTMEALGQMKLAELGWSMYDHELSNTNIKNSWDTSVIVNGVATPNFTAGVPDGFGYLYALCDYGYENNLRDHKNNNLIPHLYRKEVMERCFAVAGQTIDCDFFETERFKRTVIGAGGGSKQTISPAEVATRRCEYTGSGDYTFPDVHPYANHYVNGAGFFTSYYQYYVNFNQQLMLANNYWSSVTILNDPLTQLELTTGKQTINRTGNYSMNVQGTFDMDLSFFGTGTFHSDFTYIAVLYKNGSFINSSSPFSFTGDDTKAIDVTFDLFCTSGDLLEVKFQFSTGGYFTSQEVPGSPNEPYFRLQVTTDGDFTIDLQSIQGSALDGDTIYISNYLPDITCAEIVKGIITEYNLYVGDPDKDGIVKIEPMEDYYFGTDVFDDWTHKVDKKKPVTIRPASNIEGKIYAFQFLRDDDYYNKIYRDEYGIGYGDYNYQVPSTFQQGTRVFQLPWAQTVPVEIPGTNIRLPTIINVDPITGVVSPYKGKTRVYYYQGLKTCDNWVLRNSAITTISETLTNYPACSHIDDYVAPTFDHNFGVPSIVYWTALAYTGVNIYSEYQDTSIREITGKDSKVWNGNVYLNEADVQIERFRVFAMINGVLFKKNIIGEFSGNGDGSTPAELVRIVKADKRRTILPLISSHTIKNPPLLDGGKDEFGSGPEAVLSDGGKNSVLLNAPVERG